MNSERVLNLLETRPDQWSFGDCYATYLPTKQAIWTANGLLCIDFYPGGTGAFSIVDKWLIKRAINRARASMFGVTV